MTDHHEDASLSISADDRDDGRRRQTEETLGEGNGTGQGTSCETRGGGGSNPSPRTIYPATHAHEDLTRHMCRIVGLRPHHRVLEPSAGAGGMVAVLKEFTSNITVVELNGGFYMQLCHWHPDVERYRSDFLLLTPGELGLFDRIIMCPPSNTIPHLNQAVRFLKPAGKIIALVQDQNIKEFPEHAGWRRFAADLPFEFAGQPVACSTWVWGLQ